MNATAATDMAYLVAGTAVMFAVTYALRVVPLVALRREITDPRIRSFLHYVPFAVLTAMTLPGIVLATRHPASGVVALVVAVLVSWSGRSLPVVAVAAAAAVWLSELVMGLG